MAKVSVLMPVYNGEKFLEEAVKSVVNQTFMDWELIIINDGSTDKSEEIIKSFLDARIKYYKNDRNIGLIGTLNKGIELCQGDYVARMDADDISISQRFEYQLSFLEKNQSYSMCGCNAIVINDRSDEIGHIINLYSNQYLQINLLFSVPFVHPGMMIRTTILKKFKYDIAYKHGEDYDLWCRIAETTEIANLRQCLIKYRWHSNNISVENANTQDKIKNKIIRRQLNKLGLTPSDKDLNLHKVTFEQYSSKEKKKLTEFNQYADLNNWFTKIIDANRSKKKYTESNLISYLWSRWFVLCIAQKKYKEIFKPKFVSYNLNIFIKTFKLIYLLSKK